jgi:uncharacterized protein (TIGR00251 family)
MRDVAGGVRVAVRLTPRTRADRIEGIRCDAAGRPVLCVTVTAPPVENQANDALLRLLAREWRLPRRDIAIIGGHKSREKLVHIAGDAAAINARLAALLGAFSE